MTQDPKSSLSGWVLTIARTLEEVGLDSGKLLRELGMNPDNLANFKFRFDQEQVTRLWHRAEKLTGDPNLGLKAAKHLHAPNLHVLGHAMNCSGTLKKALQRFIRFGWLIADAGVMELRETDDCYVFALEVETDGKPPAYQAYDVCLAGLVTLFRSIMDDADLAPAKVCFKHAAPSDDSLYRELFRCPVEFGQDDTLLYLPKALMEQPIPTANEELAILLDELAAKYLTERQEGKFAQQVRATLVTMLPNGEPNKAAVAKTLKLSDRTLLRRLQAENTTYQEVLDHLREEMAYGYLRRKDLPLEETAYLLGFSDVSTFSRAFKRWTGESPGTWRTRAG